MKLQLYCVIFLIVFLTHSSFCLENPTNILSKLNERLVRTDSSIQLVRNKIAASTNAPFLPDLYQQLGELLLEKANAIYFLHAEKSGKTTQPISPNNGTENTVQDRQVLGLQNEAISVFNRILESFPNYARKANTLFLLAATLRAVDNTPHFIETINTMIKDFPKTIETFRARLLMAQHLFERKIFDEALKFLEPVKNCSFVYEKNLALYRSALILMGMDKPRDSLVSLETIINDPDLDQVKSENLKHDALVESIRSFTIVHSNEQNPVEYYLKLSPSEELFQEVIEKLAFRYIDLKLYSQAVMLFRALSERIRDPERVLNIYHQALLTIPPQDRIRIPASELSRVLQTLKLWTSYFKITESTRNEVYAFFETQIRDLGTRNHDASKLASTSENKKTLLTQARDYYLLYLKFFQKTQYSSKILTNLADVYFNQKDYFHSGETYYRAYLEENEGHRPTEKTNELLKNAIFSFQQRDIDSFYEQLRGRALLLKTIENYQKDNPQLRSDPKLNFVYLKTMYEQGFYDFVIPSLYKFISRFATSPYATDAVDLILDYYNTINDLKGLTASASKLLAMGIPNPKLNQHIRGIQTSASFKRVEKQIQSALGYNNSAEGKQYLNAALSSGDASLIDAALKEALNLSKSEKDIDTFFNSANALVEKELKLERKSDLLNSIASENIKLTRFVGAEQAFIRIFQLGANQEIKLKSFSERIKIALLLRDVKTLGALSEYAEWTSLDDELKKRSYALAIDLLLSGAAPPQSLLQKLTQDSMDENTLVLLYRSKGLLLSQFQQKIFTAIQNLCFQQSQSVLCRWKKLDLSENISGKFIASLSSTSLIPESLELKGNEFVSIDKIYREIENSGDPYLDSMVTIKSHFLYSKFADFLGKMSDKNPSLQEPLRQKMNESLSAARKFQQSCQNIITSAALPQRYSGFCIGIQNISIDTFLSKPIRSFGTRSSKDPMNKKILELQKKLLAGEDRLRSILSLAKEYLLMGNNSHAAGTANFGLSLGLTTANESEGELKIILGCSLIELGFISEANFQLNSTKHSNQQKTRCLNEAKNI